MKMRKTTNECDSSKNVIGMVLMLLLTQDMDKREERQATGLLNLWCMPLFSCLEIYMYLMACQSFTQQYCILLFQ